MLSDIIRKRTHCVKEGRIQRSCRGPRSSREGHSDGRRIDCSVGSIGLRPIRMSDAEQCFRWMSDPGVRCYLGVVQTARTLAMERGWIASVLADKMQQRVFIIEDEKGSPIGTCGLRGIDRDGGTAYFGIMIGEKRLWDRGYGTAATKKLLAYAFTELGLEEVRLSCHTDNYRAIRCYRKAGFQPSSHGPERRQFGRREVRMAVDRAHWERQRNSESAKASPAS